jgi:hypothetical protein
VNRAGRAFRTAGSATIAATWVLSFAVIASGVPAGAIKPSQITAS